MTKYLEGCTAFTEGLCIVAAGGACVGVDRELFLVNNQAVPTGRWQRLFERVVNLHRENFVMACNAG